jgi:hypothetical protein
VIGITVLGGTFQYTRSRAHPEKDVSSRVAINRKGEKKAENPTMVRGVHPEFGYLCLSPNLRRKLWLASVTCALVGASGLGMFMTRANLEALAFAPVGSQSREATPATPEITHLARLKSAFVADVESGMCQNRKPTNPNGSCSFSKAREPIRALNERPAIAAVLVGQPNPPTATAALEASKTTNAPAAVDAPAAETPPPTAGAEKPEAEQAAFQQKSKSSRGPNLMDQQPRPQYPRDRKNAMYTNESAWEVDKLRNLVEQRIGARNLARLEERLRPMLSRTWVRSVR